MKMIWAILFLLFNPKISTTAISAVEDIHQSRCFAPVSCTSPSGKTFADWMRVPNPTQCETLKEQNCHEVSENMKKVTQDLQLDFNRTVSELTSKHDKEISDLQSDFNDTVSKLISNHDKEIAELKDINSKHEAEILKMTSQIEKVLDLKLDFNRTVSKFASKHDKEISELEESLNESTSLLGTMQRSFNQTISEINSKRDAEVQNISAQMEKVNLKVNEEFVVLKAQVDLINSTVTELHQKIFNMFPKLVLCDERGGFVYNGRCFWIILNTTDDVNFGSGEELCHEAKGNPGDVFNQELYDMVANLARSKLPSSISRTYFWTGMKYSSSTRELTLSNGSTSTFAKWWSSYDYPSSDSTYTGIKMIFYKDPSQSHGMYNDQPTNGAYGVLCQE